MFSHGVWLDARLGAKSMQDEQIFHLVTEIRSLLWRFSKHGSFWGANCTLFVIS